MIENMNLNEGKIQLEDETQKDMGFENLMNGEETGILTENGSHKEIKENKELGLVYEETVIELSEQRQKEMGIKRIRRKKIISILGEDPLKVVRETVWPSYTEDNTGQYLGKNKEKEDQVSRIFHLLTEGSFHSYRTINHVMWGDSRRTEEGVQKLIDEGLYFGKILPADRLTSKVDTQGRSKSPFFSRVGGELKKDESYPDYNEDALMCYDLSVSSGESIWDYYRGPIFIFGDKNKSFREYVESILSNPETQQMMRLDGWNVDKPVEYKPVEAPENSYKWGNDDKILFEPEKQKEKEASVVRSKSRLEAVINGLPITYKYSPHPLLPIIQHPDIKPLRWCNADVGIITTEKNINILFFETE